MNPKFKEILKIVSIPLTLLAIYGSMALLWTAFHLPSDEQMIGIIKGWFTEYGLWIVFFGAIIEGFLLVGQYFPGGFIIFLGVASAGDDVMRAILVVSVVCISFFIAYTMNYLVGKYGLYRIFMKFGLRDSFEKAKLKLHKQELNAVIFSYWDPNLASITAAAAGVLNIPLARFSFFSSIGIVVWNTFWGTLTFFVGEALLHLGIGYMLGVFAIWIAILLAKKYLFTAKTASLY